MSTSTRQTTIPLWHYHCPECGFGDSEMGHRAAADAIYCEVCLEDSQRVKLKRWPVDAASGALLGSGPRRG